MTQGASGKPDRACAPSGLSRDASQAEPLVPSADIIEADREMLLLTLYDAKLQLQYLDSRWPTGTTPAVVARIESALREALPWERIKNALADAPESGTP